MVRVRFAPSPTGALHIGGVRTALYNYLFARQQGGTFILRIEDTDQTRYVPGAEAYIVEALQWLGLTPDEGVGFGGEYGPYRQSDRKPMYREYAEQLVANGCAYYAFDTPDELDAQRAQIENFTYNHLTRGQMSNSLTLGEAATQAALDSGKPWVIRMKVEPNRDIRIHDLVRGLVTVNSSELDDKVLLKGDGMPTYHLANIVDDHLMAITHVIRGEEWLPSTAHHVLLYEGFGWSDTMPKFAHLPLILKPVGDGKLSKRDGAKFGMPVFPLSWRGETPDDSFDGFRETGFLPEAVLNFLALLGWHPEGDREMFSLPELIEAFSMERIGKSGARFDYEKAKWFNQKYLAATDNHLLAERLQPYLTAAGYEVEAEYAAKAVGLMKERVTFLPDLAKEGYFLFEPVRVYDHETVQKKWKPELVSVFEAIIDAMATTDDFSGSVLEEAVKSIVQTQGFKPGDVLPLLRIALVGTMKGPAVFDTMVVLGRDKTVTRLTEGLKVFSV